MDRLQRYRNDVASNGPPPSPTSSLHLSRPPRTASSLTAQSPSARPQLVLHTASPTRIPSSYRFPPSPSPVSSSPLSPRISRSAVRPNFPQHRNSNHSILAQLDSPNMPSAQGLGIPTLPAEYTRGRTGESSSRLSATRRSRSHGRPTLSHTRSNSSTSSATSSSSSLFDRPGRAGSIAGSETSDDSRSIISVQTSKSGKSLKNRPSGLSLRSRTKSQTNIVTEEEEEIIPPVPPLPGASHQYPFRLQDLTCPVTATLTRQPTYGPTLWERLVASAAATAKEWNFYGEGEDEYDERTSQPESLSWWWLTAPL
ncbi:hypothetical protein CALCODRAFT_177639 [Calocera cornea HHB12733]|uniref:Uncharacterized protein n=1 Tax=Calocera cornea HHB12733 TaxID=1353952 RepID=A0A165HVX2_9BASI|nr:hypothetical protein CALCODRAFT_177639 [Calocera cornea HHB12733]